MSDARIKPVKGIKGNINIPPDKSISHRAVMIGSMAHGQTLIKNFLTSEDCLHTLKAFCDLGVSIQQKGDTVIIEGKGAGSFKAPSKEIYLGNSGTSMRLLAGILAGQPFKTVLTGDESLSERPMARIIKPLRMMGADISGRNDKFPPLTIKSGKLKAVQYESPVASAQVKSAVMLAALYADGVTSVTEPSKSRDHTERMLEFFGAEVDAQGLKVSVKGRGRLEAKSVRIPRDPSSAAYFIVLAAILKNSGITLPGILHNPTRIGFIKVLNDMGAGVQVKNVRRDGPEEICDIEVRPAKLKAIKIEPDSIPKLIDELPILMVAACFAKGSTEIRGGSELRVKETDRIKSMHTNLKKMGADISVAGDVVTITGTDSLHGADLESFGDHRTAMSMIIAGKAAAGESLVKGTDCIGTSFPGFLEMLNKSCSH